MDSVGEGDGGKIWENGIETCIISSMKRVASPGSRPLVSTVLPITSQQFPFGLTNRCCCDFQEKPAQATRGCSLVKAAVILKSREILSLQNIQRQASSEHRLYLSDPCWVFWASDPKPAFHSAGLAGVTTW